MDYGRKTRFPAGSRFPLNINDSWSIEQEREPWKIPSTGTHPPTRGSPAELR